MIDKVEEFTSDVGLDILAKRRIKPYVFFFYFLGMALSAIDCWV